MPGINKPFKSYDGGKESPGVFQTIINNIRPHKTLIIPFLGNCAITRHIKSPEKLILIDKDLKVIKAWENYLNQNSFRFNEVDLIQTCGIEFLAGYKLKNKTVIYCDPPYLMHTRSYKKRIYKHEMTDKDHCKLLKILKEKNCDVLISCIKNDLYNEFLFQWNELRIMSNTRAGQREESLYMNFTNTSGLLHDYSYLGQGFRKREWIRNKTKRHIEALKRMNIYERNKIIEDIIKEFRAPEKQDKDLIQSLFNINVKYENN